MANRFNQLISTWKSTWQRWRMKDREFQRQVDFYRLHLLLSYRDRSQKGLEISPEEVDGITSRTESLAPDVRERECQSLIDAQVKKLFLALASQVLFHRNSPQPLYASLHSQVLTTNHAHIRSVE